MESAGIAPVVVNRKRGYISLAPTEPERPFDMQFGDRTFSAQSMTSVEVLAKEFGAEIVPDEQFELDGPPVLVDAAIEVAGATLEDVTRIINVDAAWETSRGSGVTIAIVDTGIHGAHPEFPVARRAGGWAIPGDDAWTDWEGHGTMCACIAAGDAGGGAGRHVGVAPHARIMSCKTHFFDSELGAIYDELTDRARAGELIVSSNSFGRNTGSPPPPPSNSDFLPALQDALNAGVFVIFSAGNNHQLAGGAQSACSPTSVWLHKSRADVLAVATCKLDDQMWFYSSRGPGQHHGDPNTNRKPDVTAPTPENGRILYGSGERILANGWGTSGACPQVAGLAALIRAAHPTVARAALYDAIRASARDLPLGWECCGDGVIDCGAALARAAEGAPGGVGVA